MKRWEIFRLAFKVGKELELKFFFLLESQKEEEKEGSRFLF